MRRRNTCTTALAIAAVVFLLSGCGSDGGTSAEPSSSVSIAPPKVSAILPKSSGGGLPQIAGVFTNGLFPFALEQKPIATVDAQQRLFVHLNTYGETGNAPNEWRSANFATLEPSSQFSLGSLNTTHPIRGVLRSKAGVSYVSFSEGAWFSSLMRPTLPPILTQFFNGAANEVALGPAMGGELFAARLMLNSGTYTLETRKTASGVWGVIEQTSIALPADFAPDRTVDGVRYQLQRFGLSTVLSGMHGDAFVVSLLGQVDPPPVWWASHYGGNYLLWRERGSAQLRTISFKSLCQSPSPRGCLFNDNYGFKSLALADNGDVTYVSDEFDSSSPLFGSRWYRAAATPQQLWLSPFSIAQTAYSLTRQDRFGFALAADGSMRSWANNGNEINLLEGPMSATPAPVSWITANGELASCREGMRCRIFRAESADRLAYLAWDKPARRATLFVSDRGANGSWKHVAYRDVSELLSGLDETGEIELSAFIAAGTSDLVIGATRTGQFLDQIKLFALNVSAKNAK